MRPPGGGRITGVYRSDYLHERWAGVLRALQSMSSVPEVADE